MFVQKVVSFASKRLFSTATSANLLKVLRQKTGYSISACKNALKDFEYDLEKAEVFLEQQAKAKGWAKTQRHVKTMDGLLGINQDTSGLYILELNCQTDFVAKNVIFQNLLLNLLATFKDFSPSPLTLYGASDLNFEEKIVSNVVRLGETIQASKAFFLPRDDFSIGLYTHGGVLAEGIDLPDGISLSKYAGLVWYKNIDENFQKDDIVGRNLAQHVVGMRPTRLTHNKGDKDISDCFLAQEYLLDDERTVFEYTNDAGVKIIGYRLFECGKESLPS